MMRVILKLLICLAILPNTADAASAGTKTEYDFDSNSPTTTRFKKLVSDNGNFTEASKTIETPPISQLQKLKELLPELGQLLENAPPKLIGQYEKTRNLLGAKEFKKRYLKVLSVLPIHELDGIEQELYLHTFLKCLCLEKTEFFARIASIEEHIPEKYFEDLHNDDFFKILFKAIELDSKAFAHKMRIIEKSSERLFLEDFDGEGKAEIIAKALSLSVNEIESRALAIFTNLGSIPLGNIDSEDIALLIKEALGYSALEIESKFGWLSFYEAVFFSHPQMRSEDYTEIILSVFRQDSPTIINCATKLGLHYKLFMDDEMESCAFAQIVSDILKLTPQQLQYFIDVILLQPSETFQELKGNYKAFAICQMLREFIPSPNEKI